MTVIRSRYDEYWDIHFFSCLLHYLRYSTAGFILDFLRLSQWQFEDIFQKQILTGPILGILLVVLTWTIFLLFLIKLFFYDQKLSYSCFPRDESIFL